MDIDKLTTAQLFERPRRFLVPLFQRRYVWSEKDQWLPLWEDLVSQAEALQRARNSYGSSPRLHFMGAVVLGREQTAIREVPSSLLVDGQQRLTTISVLLAALRDAGKELNNEFMTQTLQRLLRNPEPLMDPVEAYKVWPTQGDQQAFEHALTLGSVEAIEAEYPAPRRPKRRRDNSRPPIIQAYLFFAEAIAAYINDGAPGEVESRANDLFEALTRHLQFVAIELDEEEDPQVIFETLNARGVPLLPSDLIRNFIFLRAQRQDADPEQLYEHFWKEFDSDWKAEGEKQPFWQDMIKQGRIKRPRIDLFLFHFTTLSVRQEIRIDHLFSEFRAWWMQEPGGAVTDYGAARLSSGERSIAAELARLSRFAGHFRTLQLPDPADPVGRFGGRLKAVDTSTVFPLVLTLLDKANELGRNDLEASLRDLESYLVRRMVCGLTSKGYNQVFLDLLRHLDSRGDFRHAVLREWLSSLTAESDRWPSNPEFRRAWMHEPLYARLKPQKVCMLLEAIEFTSRTERQETQSVPSGLTVEHLLPQKPRPGDYPYPDDVETDLAIRAERRSSATHSMGNLTLLTKPLNSSVSNGPWSVKRPKIAQQSLLLMNRYFDRPEGISGWNEGDIERRGSELFQAATTVWPRPGRNEVP